MSEEENKSLHDMEHLFDETMMKELLESNLSLTSLRQMAKHINEAKQRAYDQGRMDGQTKTPTYNDGLEDGFKQCKFQYNL